MKVKGYKIQYSFKTDHPKTAYKYQRFFRAIYGYTQVVKKANGKTYVYRRKGVLTDYPYIKISRKTVVVPSNAMTAMLTFFKTSKNPTHDFTQTEDWTERISYTIEEVDVDPDSAVEAVLLALKRVVIQLPSVVYSGDEALENVDKISQSDAYVVLTSLTHIFDSEWCQRLKDHELLKNYVSNYNILKSIYS